MIKTLSWWWSCQLRAPMMIMIMANKSIDGGLRRGISRISPVPWSPSSAAECDTVSSSKKRGQAGAAEREGTRHSSLFAAQCGDPRDRRGRWGMEGGEPNRWKDQICGRTTHIASARPATQHQLHQDAKDQQQSQQQQQTLLANGQSDCQKRQRTKLVWLSAISTSQGLWRMHSLGLSFIHYLPFHIVLRWHSYLLKCLAFHFVLQRTVAFLSIAFHIVELQWHSYFIAMPAISYCTA